VIAQESVAQKCQSPFCQKSLIDQDQFPLVFPRHGCRSDPLNLAREGA
jgi:hypothetical protein